VPVGFTISGDWATVDGTATGADNDYIPASGTWVIQGGQTESTPISVQVVGDRKIELDETFSIVASNVMNGIPPVPLVLTILNDDVATTSVSNASVTEGNAGTTPMSFTVTLTSPSAIPIQVSYFTTDGTAVAGQDYEAATDGALVFPLGVTQQIVTVNVIGDTTFEPDETFTFTATPAGGTASTATGTILNDDVRTRRRA
jgi:hypothetical protein